MSLCNTYLLTDPDSFKEAKLAGVGAKDFEDGEDDEEDDDEDHEEEDDEDDEDEEDADWDYMRVDGLGFIPGLCCPHHDRIQSNGVLRAYDMDEMILRHPTEVGICIDHNAAFQINGNEYKVLYPKVTTDEEDIETIDPVFLVGSVSPDGTFDPDRTGIPGCWIKHIVGGNVVDRMLCPDVGEVSSILVIPETIRQSTRNLKIARSENPDTGPMRMSYMASNNTIANSTTFSPKSKRNTLSKLKEAMNLTDVQRSSSLSPTTTPGRTSLLEQIFDDDNEDDNEDEE